MSEQSIPRRAFVRNAALGAAGAALGLPSAGRRAASATPAGDLDNASYHVDASRGDDGAAGTLERPWRTLRASIPRLRAGDTLVLRGGTFPEHDLSIAVRGTAERPITIRNHPGESPIVDGALPEFRRPGNADWEIVDPAIHLYVSRKSYPDPQILHGYFDHGGVKYKLVGYDEFADLTATSQFASEEIPFYVGPGAHWRKSDGKLYVRMVQSDIARENGYDLPGLPTDPREIAILLSGNGTVLRAEKESAHVHLEGLTVQGQEHALEFAPGGASHFTITNSRFLGGRYNVMLGADTHDVLFEGITIDGGAPDWIAWLDVKSGRRPAQHLEAPGLKVARGVRNLEVRNCTFRRLFDGINSNDGGVNVYVHHNLFENIRDDCYQLGTHAHDVEVAYNRMIHVSKGPSFQGRGDSPRPGTKYYHHNIIDCSRKWLFARRSADGAIARLDRVKYIDDRGEVWARPVGSHGESAKDPWKIYHNTILFGQELNGTGVGLEYFHGLLFDPAVPQEVYNNIIVQVADYWLSSGARVADGSQVFDGNLYHRIPQDASHPFLHRWSGANGTRDFHSLAEFRVSPLFHESKRHYAPGFENSGVAADPRLDGEYRPAAGGPAATGAVPVPAHWPGNRGETFRGALAPGGGVG